MAQFQNKSLKTKPKYKVIIIGERGVGKMAVFKAMKKSECDGGVETTLQKSISLNRGVRITTTNCAPDSVTKDIRLQDGTDLRLQIHTMAEKDTMNSIPTFFFRGAHFIVFVFSCKHESTFSQLPQWIEYVESKMVGPQGSHIYCLIGTNEKDCEYDSRPTFDKVEITEERIEQFRLNFSNYINKDMVFLVDMKTSIQGMEDILWKMATATEEIRKHPSQGILAAFDLSENKETDPSIKFSVTLSNKDNLQLSPERSHDHIGPTSRCCSNT